MEEGFDDSLAFYGLENVDPKKFVFDRYAGSLEI